jgi:hypothetical protein
MEEGSFTGDFERKVRFFFCQGMCKTGLWKRAFLFIDEPGGGGSFTGESER